MLIIPYVWLFFLMRKYHGYEFDKNFKWFTAYFIVFMLILSSAYIYSLNNYKGLWTAFQSLENLQEFCNNGEDSGIFYKYILISQGMSFNTFAEALTILYLKKDEDILQGINKLDNLLKVSIFQVYKNKQKEIHKQTYRETTAKDWKPRGENGNTLTSE